MPSQQMLEHSGHSLLVGAAGSWQGRLVLGLLRCRDPSRLSSPRLFSDRPYASEELEAGL